ncbi:DUF6182 family protein [Nocardia sp. NPDC005978]|uniref:DUF6182 family protein n=1 Tax=Nocardia sp. NPDC005978 TaxID=3156725 RepID=UPI0033B80BD3
MLPQDALRREAEQRLTALATLAAAAESGGEPVDPAAGECVVAVVAAFDPADFVRACRDFAHALARPAVAAWCANFTRTVFLAGEPANLAVRHPADQVAAGGAIAWYGPCPAAATAGVGRLLRPFRGPVRLAAGLELPIEPRPVPDAAPTGAYTLIVDVSDLAVEEFMIHVNHSVAESTFTGALPPGAALTLRTVANAEFDAGQSEYRRIAVDRADPGRLRCYAALTRSG